MFNLRFLAAGALLLTGLAATAQDFGNSPYSRFGLGDQAPVGFIRNASMAGVGVASPNSYQINDINPALMFYNNLVIFEMGASAQLKRIENRQLSQQGGNVNLRYLAFSFPVNKHWTTGFGLKPFSSVSYKIVTEAPIVTDTIANNRARYLYQGSGGINEVYWSNGFKLYKGLTAGVSASYLFGSIQNESAAQVLDQNNTGTGSVSSLLDRRTLKDFAFKGGLAYRTKINDKLNLGAGVTYQYLLDFKAKQLRTITTGIGFVDTLSNEFSQESRLEVPQPLQAGISIDNGSRWMLGLDVHTQDWSQFSAFGESAGSLKRSYRVALGGEITPDPGSVSSYFKRMTFRGGLSYGKSPIYINGTQLTEQQASFGFGLPTGRTGSSVNMAFVAGSRGTTDNSLIRETYYRFELGFSLNDRWFQRPKID